MTKTHKIIIVIFLTFVCATIVSYQYKTDKEIHERLNTIGLTVKVTAKHYVSGGVDYANYYFITASGQKIERNQKCGNEFIKYASSSVIYNPTDPNEFEFLFDYNNYSAKWNIIFYFFTYLPIMTIVTSGWVIGITSIVLRLKEKKNSI